MSRAVVFDTYGGPDVLHVIDVPVAEPGPGQLRVRVRAAGVQPFDGIFRSGAARQWMPASFPQRLGNEFAGVVEAVGDGVTAVAPGAEVLGWAGPSCYADHVVVSAEQVVPKPAGVAWSVAGVLSASGQTAATALRVLAVREGETVLIHAAAGGVGSFAVQLARELGARVVGTARPANHDYLRELGAIPVAYGSGLAQRVRDSAPQGVDAALVAVSSAEALESSWELVPDKQRIGTVAFSPAATELGIRTISTERSIEQLARLARLNRDGRLTVSIAGEYRWEQAAQAHQVLETGHVRGKLVMTATD
jgi:enoyl reductase